MDKTTFIWKLACALVIATAAILLLGGILTGDVLYQLPAPPLP